MHPNWNSTFSTLTWYTFFESLPVGLSKEYCTFLVRSLLAAPSRQWSPRSWKLKMPNNSPFGAYTNPDLRSETLILHCRGTLSRQYLWKKKKRRSFPVLISFKKGYLAYQTNFDTYDFFILTDGKKLKSHDFESKENE